MIIVGGVSVAELKVIDLIKGAMRPLNVLAGNTTLTDEEAQDALLALNWMLESWSNDGLTLYHVVRETFSLSAGINPHTWGPGGNFDSARPTRVLMATINVGGVDYPLTLMGYDDWESIRLKGLIAAWPIYGYYEADYPLGKFWLWPVPTGHHLNVQSEKPLSTFRSIYDDVLLPPGYVDALRYNLACRLAPEYQLEAPADVQRLAFVTLKAIKRSNSRPQTMAIDPALRGNSMAGRYVVWTDGIR